MKLHGYKWKYKSKKRGTNKPLFLYSLFLKLESVS